MAHVDGEDVPFNWQTALEDERRSGRENGESVEQLREEDSPNRQTGGLLPFA